LFAFLVKICTKYFYFGAQTLSYDENAKEKGFQLVELVEQGFCLIDTNKSILFKEPLVAKVCLRYFINNSNIFQYVLELMESSQNLGTVKVAII